MPCHLVTGATGFLGRHLVRQLLERGDTVYALVRAGSSKRPEDLSSSIAPYLNGRPRGTLQYILGDVTKPYLGLSQEILLKLLSERPNIWHLAANLSFRRRDRVIQHLTNVRGTHNVVALANELGSRLFYTSTAYVGGTKCYDLDESQLDIGQSFHNNYERTKFYAEQLVRQECRVPCIIFRPSIIIGDAHVGKAEGCTFGYYRFIYVFYIFRQWINRQRNQKTLMGLILNKMGTVDVGSQLSVPWLRLPYPIGTVVDLVPVEYVVGEMIARSDQPSENGKLTFHITHATPPKFEQAMQAVLFDVGFRDVRYIPLSPWAFKVLFVLAYYSLIPWRKYLRSAKWYLPYVMQTWLFINSSSRGVPPAVDRDYLARVNKFALNDVFNREDLRASLLN